MNKKGRTHRLRWATPAAGIHEDLQIQEAGKLMWRVAFSFTQPERNSPSWFNGVWHVKKCYALRPASAASALPVKVDRDHGRKRLLILCPVRLSVNDPHTPLELLRRYLHALPVAEKVRRANERS